MAAVTLLALDLRLPGGLIGGSGDIDEARTMAFTTLVFAQLFNCFNARSDRTSAFHRLFTASPACSNSEVDRCGPNVPFSLQIR